MKKNRKPRCTYRSKAVKALRRIQRLQRKLGLQPTEKEKTQYDHDYTNDN